MQLNMLPSLSVLVNQSLDSVRGSQPNRSFLFPSVADFRIPSLFNISTKNVAQHLGNDRARYPGLKDQSIAIQESVLFKTSSIQDWAAVRGSTELEAIEKVAKKKVEDYAKKERVSVANLPGRSNEEKLLNIFFNELYRLLTPEQKDQIIAEKRLLEQNQPDFFTGRALKSIVTYKVLIRIGLTIMGCLTAYYGYRLSSHLVYKVLPQISQPIMNPINIVLNKFQRYLFNNIISSLAVTLIPFGISLLMRENNPLRNLFLAPIILLAVSLKVQQLWYGLQFLIAISPFICLFVPAAIGFAKQTTEDVTYTVNRTVDQIESDRVKEIWISQMTHHQIEPRPFLNQVWRHLTRRFRS